MSKGLLIAAVTVIVVVGVIVLQLVGAMLFLPTGI